jgi:hypothetical protein
VTRVSDGPALSRNAIVPPGRERLESLALALVVTAVSLFVGLAFRRQAMPAISPETTSWDAALHVLSGLDLYDNLRLGHPLAAIGGLVDLHWWPPGYAFLSAPCFALAGRTVPAATLPSFLSFVLAPAVLLATVLDALRASTRGEKLAAALLLTGVYASSPMLVETSAWPMLESSGGFLAALAWRCYVAPGKGWSRWAFVLAAVLFFLKYHYGFFVLASFGADLLLSFRPELRSWAVAVRPLRWRWLLVLLVLGGVAIGTRVALEYLGGDSPAACRASRTRSGSFTSAASSGA